MSLHPHRQQLQNMADAVRAGRFLRAWTDEVRYTPGRCAQAIREGVEVNLGYSAGAWEVALAALVHAKKLGTPRWASHYEQAVKDLELEKPFSQALPGDLLFWAYTAPDGKPYGHLTMFVGDGMMVENTDASVESMLRIGATQLIKGTARRPGRVWLSPIKRMGNPRTTAWPTVALRDAEKKATPAKTVVVSPKPVPPKVPATKPAPVAPAHEPIPWVQVRYRDGVDALTPHMAAVYHGVKFERVPGGVILTPPAEEL